MSAFTFVSSDTHETPRPTLRTCSICYARNPRDCRHELSDDWICSGCGEVVRIHQEVEPCKRCGKPAATRYLGNRRKQMCECQFSDDERGRIAEAEVEQQRQIARDKAREIEQGLETRRLQALAADRQQRADKCWASKQRNCTLPKDKLFDWCGECARFKARKERT